MNPHRLLLALCFALTLLVRPIIGQTELAGRLLEKVACSKDTSQTYALYVPTSYTPKTSSPIIFCFDPGARGLEPVKRLRDAAEKHGYIVAGSLNSRNGPWTANAAAIQAMVGDVQAHLNLDPKRIYTAGLSGGARVATQLALSGLAKGVIACSAGFPASEEGMPAKLPFVFFGTAGTEDFNLREMTLLDGELDDMRAVHRIVVFEGGHEWAPASLLGTAVEWLVLNEMRAGTRVRDETFISATLAARKAAIPAAPVGELWRANKEIAADFAKLADVADYEKKAKELAASREFKDWRKAERALMNREDALLSDLADAAGDSPTAMRKKVTALRAQADAPTDSVERKMARRVLASFAASAREGVKGLIEAGDYDTATSLLETAIAIHPEQSRNYFELARVHALSGAKKKALDALQQVAEHGYSDAQRLETEPAFAKLKADPAWSALVQKIKANPPELNPRGRGRQ